MLQYKTLFYCIFCAIMSLFIVACGQTGPLQQPPRYHANPNLGPSPDINQEIHQQLHGTRD